MATIALPSSVAAQSGTGTRLRLWPEWLTLFLYAALVAFAIPFHEPWADEAQAWQLVHNAPLLDLFTNYLRHEGHPSLWYLLLYALKECHFSYEGMRWFTGLVATASAGILIFRSPFPRLARFTLPFTFFLAYQYAVVARSYVLVPLLLFLLAVVWRDENGVKPALLLGLLANVCLHSAAVSLGFATIYFLELRDGTRRVTRRKTAFVLFVALFAVAMLTVLPQPRDLLGPTLPPNLSPAMIAALWPVRSIIYLGRGLISFPWYLGLTMLGVMIWALRGTLRFRYLLPLLFVAAFSGYYFSFWHLGIAAATYIAVAWIAWPLQPQSTTARTVLTAAIALTITIQLVYTVYAVVYDHYFAYSPDLAASRYLLPLTRTGTPIAVTYVKHIKAGAYFSVGLRPYVPGPIFLNEPDLFWKWTTKEHSRADFASALRTHPPVVLVEYYDVDFRPFDMRRESRSRALSLLSYDGYVLTHTFCGAKPEDLREREHICHLIFEPASASPPSSSLQPDALKETPK